MIESLRRQEGLYPLLGKLRRSGRPLTKAEYLWELVQPNDLEFPLDAEWEASMPLGLPGRMPVDQTDLLRLLGT